MKEERRNIHIGLQNFWGAQPKEMHTLSSMPVLHKMIETSVDGGDSDGSVTTNSWPKKGQKVNKALWRL